MATRRRWTEESIRSEIAPIATQLGRMPTRRELTDRGLGGAWSAMQRTGGISQWRESLSVAPPAAAPSPESPVAGAPAAAPSPQSLPGPAPTALPSREAIARRAYFIAEQRGGDPLANWLAAESELIAA